jgi:hypothetical protein
MRLTAQAMSRITTPLSVLAVTGASIALAACGGSSSDSSSASPGANGTQTAAFQKFQQCLKDNGVTLPERGDRPGSGGGYGQAAGGRQPPTSTNDAPPTGAPGFGGQPDAKTQKAMQACTKLHTQGTSPGRGGYGAPRQNVKAFAPYLDCLKTQGLAVKVSDGFNALRNLKPDDPKVRAAFEACQPKLPQRPQDRDTATRTIAAAT